MTEVIAWVAVFVLLFGCEMKVDHQIDGQQHALVLNPKHDDKP